MDQKTATQSLRLKLMTMISHALLDRMLKVAQASTTMEIWQEAIRHNLITEAGAWNYLSWNQQTKQVQVTQKTLISMTSMQSLLEELIELIRDPTAVVRLKSLKASDQDSHQTKIMPWVLQVSLRHQRLYEVLQMLSASSVWSLLLGRLRPHTVRDNPIAASLARGSYGQSTVRLSNAQNDCYQNAAFQAMFWALLQPMWNELGEGSEKFAEPFGTDSVWISLKDLPGFGEFLRPWGEGQQDLHEFLGKFLEWIKPLCSWQRIVQEGEEIRITDRGAPHNPPTLRRTSKHSGDSPSNIG